MTDPNRGQPPKDAFGAEILREYGVRDWANTVLYQLDTDRSGATRTGQDCAWTDDALVHYELSRRDLYWQDRDGPVSGYFLVVSYATGDSKLYFYNSRVGVVRNCDRYLNDTPDDLTAEQRALEMVHCLRTAPLRGWPPGSLADPATVTRILDSIRASEYQSLSPAWRYLMRQ